MAFQEPFCSHSQEEGASNMKPAERMLLVAALASRMRDLGGWAGETHIQKCVYFFQRLLGIPVGYNFILYKHGPFSFDLRDDLGVLRRDGVLEVKVNPVPFGPSLDVTSD